MAFRPRKREITFCLYVDRDCCTLFAGMLARSIVRVMSIDSVEGLDAEIIEVCCGHRARDGGGGAGAQAQDMTTATFGGTTIWVGGGVQFLSLPDIRFTEASGHHAEEQRERLAGLRRRGRRRHRDRARPLGRLSRDRRHQRLLGQYRDRRPQELQWRVELLHGHRPDRQFRQRQQHSLHQDQPRCRLLGRPSRAEIRPRQSPCRSSPISTATTISSSAPTCAASIRTTPCAARPAPPSPTRRASIRPMPAAISASAANTASASSRASSRRTLRSPRLADLHFRARRPLQRRHRL